MLTINSCVGLDLLPCLRSSELRLDKRRCFADRPFLRVLLDFRDDQSNPSAGRQVLVRAFDLCWPTRRRTGAPNLFDYGPLFH